MRFKWKLEVISRVTWVVDIVSSSSNYRIVTNNIIITFFLFVSCDNYIVFRVKNIMATKVCCVNNSFSDEGISAKVVFNTLNHANRI